MTKHPQEPGALILCVEDEEELRRDLADELIEAGYRVIEATNGAGALEHVERLRPDLILCDISMPVMDGYALLRAIKARPEDYAEIPFVFLTALADRAHAVVDPARAQPFLCQSKSMTFRPYKIANRYPAINESDFPMGHIIFPNIAHNRYIPDQLVTRVV